MSDTSRIGDLFTWQIHDTVAFAVYIFASIIIMFITDWKLTLLTMAIVPVITVFFSLFQGKYFKQTCDIDLNGCSLKSIGYYFSSAGDTDTMRAFGGHYDGGGYRITNGRIVPAITTISSYERTYVGGLFGCIWGASVENVTLDQMTVYSRSVTGGRVWLYPVRHALARCV